MGKVVLTKCVNGHICVYVFWADADKKFMARGEVVNGVPRMGGAVEIDKAFGNDCYKACRDAGWEKLK